MSAHHSFGAEYDATKPITLSGVVKMIEWTNPHSYLHLDVTDEKGTVSSWKLEGYPPSALYRTGWKKNVSMKAGDTVKKGQPVRFTVKSDVADEIHVHGYNFHKDVAKGGSVSFAFPATIDGEFVIELESRSEQIASLKVLP